MLDHIELKTRDTAAAGRFYSEVLAPLGYALKVDGASKGLGDAAGLDLFLVEGEPEPVHFAFRAPSREIVDSVYRVAERGGHQLDRAPALAPHIHPHYYAAYLRDPDGRLVEFVSHAAPDGS